MTWKVVGKEKILRAKIDMNLFYSLFKYIDIIHLAYINRLFVSIIRVNILNDNINSDEEN